MGTGLEGIPTWRDGACKSCALETVVEQNMLSLAVIVWHRRDVLTRCLHGQILLGCIVFSVPIRRQLMCRIFLLLFLFTTLFGMNAREFDEGNMGFGLQRGVVGKVPIWRVDGDLFCG